MKIKIENYRNIVDSNLKIKEGEINYILGSNESGKTNILTILQLLDLDSKLSITEKDYTIKDRRKIKEGPSIEIDDENGRLNIVNEKNQVQFMNLSSSKREDYFLFLSDSNKKFESILNNINTEIANLSEVPSQDNSLKIQNLNKIKPIYDQIFSKKRITNDEWKFIIENDLSKDLSIKIKDKYDDLKIAFPMTHYIEPIIKAKNESKISYKVHDLTQENSVMHHIFKAFSSEKNVSLLKELDKIENMIEREGTEESLFEKLNENIKKYFESFKHINAFPFFKISGGEIILLIKSKNNWKYDSLDENQRSLGFKTFLRIIMELKAIKQSKNKHYYIIDEPEQSLHPFLQNELLKELQSIVGENITIILSSHSPYIVQIENFDDILQCQYVERNHEGKVKIKSFNNQKEILDQAEKYFLNGDNKNYYFLKVVFDSFGSFNIYKMINGKIKSLQKNIKGSQNPKKINDEIKDLIMLKNFMNEK